MAKSQKNKDNNDDDRTKCGEWNGSLYVREWHERGSRDKETGKTRENSK